MWMCCGFWGLFGKTKHVEEKGQRIKKPKESQFGVSVINIRYTWFHR